MKKAKIIAMCVLGLFLVLGMVTPTVWAAEKEYKVSYSQFQKQKNFFDDPRPYLKDLSYKKVMPPEDYAKLTYDVKAMKNLWAEVIGLRAPDLVGKIAPEIKPGTYTYKDKEKYPGLKELMIPRHYDRFKPGAPPHGGNFSEITVIPTRQYYHGLPIAEATKKNVGRTKLDEQGYIKSETYMAGYPFPRPSGKFKAQQIMNNWEKRYLMGENFFAIQFMKGFDKRLNLDFEGGLDWWEVRLNGRVTLEPYGWYDKRAEAHKEATGCLLGFVAPRDTAGTAFSMVYYLDPDRFDLYHIYISVLRRIRKMSATDAQDAVSGQDTIYEDRMGFSQKLSKNRYPYSYDLIDEREYLVPSTTLDGSLYVDSKGIEFRNLEFERRPLYVIKLTQTDKNYVYGQRILYIDKETFNVIYIENYDQKGRLYRITHPLFGFIPEMGLFTPTYVLFADYIDLHSAFAFFYSMPATWVERKHINLGGLVKRGK